MKTILTKILKIFVNVLLAIAVLLCAFTVYNKIKGNQVSLFGYSFSIVLTSSMDGAEEPVIKKGDFIITKNSKLEDIKIGDVVLYKTHLQSNLNKGIERIIHKVTAVNTDENNNIYLTTKGTANQLEDEEKVTDIIGTFVTKSSFLGKIFSFLSNPINLVFMVIITTLLVFAVKQIKTIKKELNNKTE